MTSGMTPPNYEGMSLNFPVINFPSDNGSTRATEERLRFGSDGLRAGGEVRWRHALGLCGYGVVGQALFPDRDTRVPCESSSSDGFVRKSAYDGIG